jgi:hypothetical protein
MLALLCVMQSCTIDDNGNFHLTWLFWFLLIVFAFIIIFGAISSSKEQDKTNRRLKTQGLSSSDFKKTNATYVSGHQDINGNFPFVVYRKDNEYLRFYSRTSEISMPISKFKISIKNISIEDATSIESKVTVGRLLLVGVFAFAWKKKKKNELAFTTIEWNDGRFDHTTIFNFEGKDATQKANVLS